MGRVSNLSQKNARIYDKKIKNLYILIIEQQTIYSHIIIIQKQKYGCINLLRR